MGTNSLNLLYLVTIACFVLALRFLSSPATARRGNWIGAVGMVIAIVATLLKSGINITWEMIVAALIGGGFG
ncbi:MAG: NAD(P)(+) transhydrogenase (Re/Si-specific) subunit beta, partial [Gaiellaceae bacterium]